MSAFTKGCRIIAGMIPGVDTVGGYLLTKYQQHEINEFDKEKPPKDLIIEVGLAKRMKNTRRVKRAFEIGALIVVGVALLTTVAIPIPGLTPIAALSGVALLKVLGISVGWVALARFVGAFVGYAKDVKNMVNNDKKETYSHRYTGWRRLTIPLGVSVFGELGGFIALDGIRRMYKSVKSVFVDDFKIPHKKNIEPSTDSQPDLEPSGLSERSRNTSNSTSSIIISGTVKMNLNDADYNKEPKPPVVGLRGSIQEGSSRGSPETPMPPRMKH